MELNLKIFWFRFTTYTFTFRWYNSKGFHIKLFKSYKDLLFGYRNKLHKNCWYFKYVIIEKLK
jgi:hypothetical protein